MPKYDMSYILLKILIAQLIEAWISRVRMWNVYLKLDIDILMFNIFVIYQTSELSSYLSRSVIDNFVLHNRLKVEKHLCLSRLYGMFSLRILREEHLLKKLSLSLINMTSL